MPHPMRWEERDRLHVKIEWTGSYYRAHCREYDVVATGKTLNEAREALATMIEQYQQLTNPQAWHDYFSNVQETLDEEINDGWAHGGPAID